MAPRDVDQQARSGRSFRPCQGLVAALGLLTILPVRPPAADGGGYLAHASGFFPIVGAGIGGVAALVLWGATALGFPALPAALAAVLAAALVTGALHEDGLADFADGLGGGRSREDKLRIMRDSRIGTYGVIAIVFSVALRAGALASLPTATAGLALVACGAVSRAPLPAVARWLPPARTDGLAAGAGRPAVGEVAAAALLAVAMAVAALGPRGALTALVLAAASGIALAWLAKRQLGGHTGDVLGALQQVAEVAAILAVAAA